MATTHEDHYATLSLTPTASATDIKKAYKRLALRWHPDKSDLANATVEFHRLGRAWEVLGDETRRAEYDAIYISAVEREQLAQRERKRKAEEDDAMNLAEMVKRRREEIDRDAMAAWTKPTPPETSWDALRIQAWKAKAREEYLGREKRWMELRQRYVNLLRDVRGVVEFQRTRKSVREGGTTKFQEVLANFDRVPSQYPTSPAIREYLQRFIKTEPMTPPSECEDLPSQPPWLTELSSLMSAELEEAAKSYDKEEFAARQIIIRQGLEILGPPDLKAPMFEAIDRRGKAINRLKMMVNFGTAAKFPGILEGVCGGLRHAEPRFNGTWSSGGDETCGRCDQETESMAECRTCSRCGALLCNRCIRGGRLMAEYRVWITGELLFDSKPSMQTANFKTDG